MRRNYNSYSGRVDSVKTLAVYGGAFALLLIGGRACAEAVEEPTDNIYEFVEDSGYDYPVMIDIDKIPNPAVTLGGCGKDHVIKYELDAVSANTGRKVSIVVCDGVFVGKSLRD